MLTPYQRNNSTIGGPVDMEMIVLFDGVCLFCEGWVKFTIHRTPEKTRIQFIPLENVQLSLEVQSKVLKSGGSGSILCITSDNTIFYKSDATLTVMKHLQSPYNYIAKFMQIVPLFLRNAVYDYIGKRRYKIWGKKEICILPDDEYKTHFLNSSKGLSSRMLQIHKKYFEFH